MIYFKLFANCIPVQGAKKSIICDLQHRIPHPIPNDLYDILKSYPDKSLDEIKNEFDHDNRETIDEYFAYLESKNLGFWCNNPDLFPSLNFNWEHPSLITNTIIDTDRYSNHSYDQLFSQLEDLGCKAIQFRFYDFYDVEALDHILDLLYTSTVVSLEIIMKYDAAISYDRLLSLAKKHKRVGSILLHSAAENKILSQTEDSVWIQMTKKVFNDASHCGKIDPKFFVCSLSMFTEGQKHNTCLNKKICIDNKGQIKNCPSMDTSYGTFPEVSLLDVIFQRDFQELWTINKDQIKVCRDCEYRYNCTDCRVFITDSKDIYSKPSKCHYDPYIGEWKEAL